MSPISCGKPIWRSEGHSNLNPILKALSSMRKNGVRYLLMGGQACVFYGAAEFSRDLDLVVLLDDANLDRLRQALFELDALLIAVPSLDRDALLRGHAIHFRCRRPGVSGLRIDVMSRLRGVPPFEDLWGRRTTIETEGEVIDLLSLPDLVLAKKTQRDKDWPMIRRLVEQAFYSTSGSVESVDFWLAELRSPELLIEVAGRYPEAAANSGREAATGGFGNHFATALSSRRTSSLIAYGFRISNRWNALGGPLNLLLATPVFPYI